jgi:hypothetical protein
MPRKSFAIQRRIFECPTRVVVLRTNIADVVADVDVDTTLHARKIIGMFPISDTAIISSPGDRGFSISSMATQMRTSRATRMA